METALDWIMAASLILLVTWIIPNAFAEVRNTLRWMFPPDPTREEFLPDDDPRRNWRPQ